MVPRIVLAMVASLPLLVGAPLALSQIRQTGGTQEARLSGHCHSVDEHDPAPLALGDVRIRRGGQVTVTGLRQSIYVDAGGQADIRATGAIVYVAKGGHAIVGGQRNLVYAEHGGRVVLVGQVLLTMVETIELHVHRNAAACQ
jgi:hypothetical protein